MCLYPRLIKNKKYVANKKNGGNVPEPQDKRVLVVPVGCGSCMECRKQKARQWQVRLNEDIRHNKNGKFVTLTFNEKKLKKFERMFPDLKGHKLANAVATKAVRLYMERWRKKHKKSLRHWFVTELGHTGTKRVHIHGIVWTDELEDISKIWKYGFVSIGKQRWNKGKLIYDGEKSYVNERSVNYIVKYLHKIDKVNTNWKGKVLTSPGIGRGYLKRGDSYNNRFKDEETKEHYKARNGSKLNLPIYYRNHLYNEDEKEKLWINKMDKNERWVDGKKIDISKGMEEYYKALTTARSKNKRLGFGDLHNWNEEDYKDMLDKMSKIRW